MEPASPGAGIACYSRTWREVAARAPLFIMLTIYPTGVELCDPGWAYAMLSLLVSFRHGARRQHHGPTPRRQTLHHDRGVSGTRLRATGQLHRPSTSHYTDRWFIDLRLRPRPTPIATPLLFSHPPTSKRRFLTYYRREARLGGFPGSLLHWGRGTGFQRPGSTPGVFAASVRPLVYPSLLLLTHLGLLAIHFYYSTNLVRPGGGRRQGGFGC